MQASDWIQTIAIVLYVAGFAVFLISSVGRIRMRNQSEEEQGIRWNIVWVASVGSIVFAMLGLTISGWLKNGAIETKNLAVAGMWIAILIRNNPL